MRKSFYTVLSRDSSKNDVDKNLKSRENRSPMQKSANSSFGPRKIRVSNTCSSTKIFGVKRVNQYVLLKTLGTGTSSTVVQCLVPADKDENDKYYAMKIVKRAKIAQN